MTKVTVKHAQSAIAAMYAGVALTVVTLIVPYIDHATANVLADHIRAGYPTYTQERIDSAVTTYLVYVSIIAALGVISWLWTIRTVNAGKRWARGAATDDVRARNRHRPVRPPRQRHLRGHRPATAAGLDRNAAMPGRACSGHAALDEIVIGTDQRS